MKKRGTRKARVLNPETAAWLAQQGQMTQAIGRHLGAINRAGTGPGLAGAADQFAAAITGYFRSLEYIPDDPAGLAPWIRGLLLFREAATLFGESQGRQDPTMASLAGIALDLAMADMEAVAEDLGLEI